MSHKKNNDIAIEMAQNQVIQVEGKAASQILQAYKGERYDSKGNTLNHQGRDLKTIKKYKINPRYQSKNIKQQAGFTAELIEEARKNKEYIRAGKTERIRTTDGIGMTNDMQYDHIKVRADGTIIADSGSQMKFYGVDQKKGEEIYRVVEKIVKDDSWDRYDKPIDIPKEQYEPAKKYAQSQAKKLNTQAEKLREKNLFEEASRVEEKAKKYKQAAERIRKSEVSTDEAVLARLQPEKFVAKEILCDANHAGLESAKGTAILVSAMSSAQNIYAIKTGEKNIEEAMMDVAKDTARAWVISYGVVTTGTTLKAVMHSSNRELIRRCGNTSLPTAIASSMLEVSKSFKRYADNEIDEEELLEELGGKGVGMLASGYGAAVGGALGMGLGSIVPVLGTATGAMIGSFLGSMVGYTTSTILYEGALGALKSEKISEKRRKIIEKAAKEAIAQNEQYIRKLEDYLSNSREKYRKQVVSIFNMMQCAIKNNDVDTYVNGIQQIGVCFGISLDYKSFEEFDLMMNEESSIVF